MQNTPAVVPCAGLSFRASQRTLKKQLQKNKKQFYKKILKTILRTSAIARIQRKVKHIDFNKAVEIADALYARLTYGKTHVTLQIHLY